MSFAVYVCIHLGVDGWLHTHALVNEVLKGFMSPVGASATLITLHLHIVALLSVMYLTVDVCEFVSMLCLRIKLLLLVVSKCSVDDLMRKACRFGVVFL